MATELPEPIVNMWQGACEADTKAGWIPVCDVLTGAKLGLLWADEPESSKYMVEDLHLLIRVAWERYALSR